MTKCSLLVPFFGAVRVRCSGYWHIKREKEKEKKNAIQFLLLCMSLARSLRVKITVGSREQWQAFYRPR